MKNKLIIVVGLLVLLLASWYSVIQGSQEQRSEYDRYLSEARRAAGLSIYIDTVTNYLAAIEIKDSLELRCELAEYYKQNDMLDKLIEWSDAIITAYPYEAEGYDYMAYCVLASEDYYDFYDVLDSAAGRKVSSEYLTEMSEKFKYQYDLDGYGDYNDVSIFSAGYCAVSDENGSWGYVNKNGDMVIPCSFEAAKPFITSGLAAVKEDNSYYLINTDGYKKYVDKEKRQMTDCGLFISDKMPVNFNGNYNYVDLDFNILFGEYEYAGAFNNGVAAVQENSGWYLINEKGEHINSGAFDDIRLDEKGIAFRNEVGFAKSGNGYYMINTAAERVGDTQYEDAQLFASDQPTSVKKNGKWGFIDSTGNEVIAPQYENARPFSNDLAAVSVNGLWGYINQDNQIVITPAFEEVREFTDTGSTFVKVDGQWKILKLYRLNKESY